MVLLRFTSRGHLGHPEISVTKLPIDAGQHPRREKLLTIPEQNLKFPYLNLTFCLTISMVTVSRDLKLYTLR